MRDRVALDRVSCIGVRTRASIATWLDSSFDVILRLIVVLYKYE